MYFAWYGFFSFSWNKTNAHNTALEKSPEWNALLDRRQEIESDPMLDEASKRVLIDNWQTMALESKPHMDTSQNQQTPQAPWAKPVALPLFIAGMLVIAALLTYLIGAVHTGSLKWPQPNQNLSRALSVDQAVTSSAGHPGDGASLQERLASLQARLVQQPDDLRGWVLLSRTHAAMSNYSDSAIALKKALELTPGHPDILADLADMTAMAQGRQLAGEPETYIAAALQSDPRHEKALALAASAAEQAGDNNKAQMYWQLLSQVKQASLKVAVPEADNSLTKVQLVLPQKMPASLKDSSALFVFMKAQSGPGMPLAVVRVPASQLQPNQVVRFAPENFLQQGSADNLPDTLYFQARLSIEGVAQPGTGDIESAWVSIVRSDLSAGLSLDLSQAAPAK